MTTDANPITVPGKTGYTFSGYYTSTSCGGEELINNSGYITNNKFSSTYTNKDITLYACWKDTTAPTLTLTKTGTVEGFKGWNLTSGASVDSNQILTLASTSARGTSPFYQVDEEKYDGVLMLTQLLHLLITTQMVVNIPVLIIMIVLLI